RPLTPWPALLVEHGECVLVVADLHLGYEYELAGQGINLPSQTPKILDSLIRLLEKFKPGRLLILGDLKHNIPRLSIQEWYDLPPFFEEVRRRVAMAELIPGNHDGGVTRIASSALKILSRRGVLVNSGKERVGFFHGHTWPAPRIFEADTWVVGHNHPAVMFRGLFGFRSLKPAWVKVEFSTRTMVEAFLKHRNVNFGNKKPERVMENLFGVQPRCSKLVIMPAFNDLLGGLAFNSKPATELLGPIVRPDCVDLARGEVFLTDGTFLGSLEHLRKLS
ncbi:MAG: metallophosphoesterase, partial [Candidatus Bathyarchaeia archaeon]